MPAALKKGIPHLLLIAYVVAVLYPFVFVVFSSLKESNQAIAENPWGFPFEMKFENYVNAWVNAKISVYFWNSLYLSTTAAVSGVLIAAAMAFAITRMRFGRSSKLLTQFVLIGMLIPGNALFISQYLLVRDLHILNTHWALFLPYVAGAVPMSVLLIAAFMRAIPGELEEAAVMDGLSSAGLFARIVLPLTVPALVTVFIINFLGNWNEFLLANFFLNKDSLRTLPTGMVGFRDTFQTNYAQMCTGIVYSVVPVLIIYAFLQEKIIEGLTAGGVKG
ncbi:carbohydrate ABC transporter permease [Paenibacillus beijingensis]|uniref:Sugar ABC transporter permease n=1 Tax=Paenibacillus beijingensis TaxID=1126833 RepID=A0A0D5NPQ4_9BACL|nr:carbohydrate ABC transporter permease [Paenibacillus beijingensis]AJY76913.1 sugar ABC transporter permease [Paenibacillus beijingensis]